MPTFVYQAKDKKGARVEGTIDADGRSAVVTRLQQMGYFPITIKQGGKGPAKATAQRTTKTAVKKAVTKESARPKEAPESFASSFRSRKIKAGDVAGFNRQVADLIGAGIPLVKALGILKKQTTNEKLKQVITEILEDVQGGETFADSLKKHPKVFSKLYVAMVKAGEAGGMLDDVLNRLADMSEEEEQLRGKIKSAMAYPTVMILAGGGALFVMFSYVVPKITATFEQLQQTLPAITLTLITISEAFQNYWYIILIGMALAVFMFVQFTRTQEGKLLWHKTQLRLPLIGSLVRKREVARFSRTLGSLLQNGVSILAALDIVREVVDNMVMKDEVDKVVEEITQGSSVARPLEGSQVFPPTAVNMIAIGEETGRLPDVLIRVSESFEGEVDRAVRALTSLIEPIIIVAMGVVVGFIVIAMLLPIFSLDPTGGM